MSRMKVDGWDSLVRRGPAIDSIADETVNAGYDQEEEFWDEDHSMIEPYDE